MKRPAHKVKRLITWTLLAASLIYIIYEVHSFNSLWDSLARVSVKKAITAALFVFLLMLLNWGIEAKKWQYLVLKVLTQYSYLISLQTVISGITLGLFTPNRVGEYGARIFYVENEHKADLLIFAFIDRIAQLWVTIFIGLGFTFLYVVHILQEYLYFILACAVLLFIFHVTVIFMRNKIIRFVVNQKRLKRYFTEKIFLSWRDVIVVLGYAAVRYIVFVLQYLIWGYYTDENYSIQAGLICVNTMLFIKSVVPSAGLSELGIRESVLMYTYKSYGLSTFTAFHSALAIYVINLLIPGIIGLLFIMRAALKSSEV
ncbi:MAG: flippase-like domain-containing protein [Bacteroidia bacterium]|nr:flippase-like domain-containing protein [Bacteroidia bacterium]MDW8301870.1 lysylphosphatidylglycerol synthase domain-containing protein [Bacteroidia bacterium]